MGALRVGAAVLVALAVATAGRAEDQFNSPTMGNRSRVRPTLPTITAAGLELNVAVKQSIAITKVRDLGFGYVIAGTTAGTVIVTANGVRSATGGTALGGPGDMGTATFVVSGEPHENYRINLPNEVNLANGNDHMKADTFTSSPNNEGRLDVTGHQTLRVGATLHVEAHQAPGFYTKFFHVMVAYD